MNGNLCEKCGHEMVSISDTRPIGMTCPNCGWGWATTYIEPIFLDDEDYHVILLSNDSSVSIIKIISEITTHNYIAVKKMIENAPVEIFIGKANEVKEIKEKLESTNIKYKIEPEFSY